MAIVLSVLALYWLLMGGGAKTANTAGVTFYDHNLLDLTFDTKLQFRTKLSKYDVKICGRCERAFGSLPIKPTPPPPPTMG